jgi:hypothetical protein
MGEGEHDFRDSDAMIAEEWTPEQITRAIERGMVWPLGVIECTVCEGTGLVDDEFAKDMAAAATAAVDQIRAKMSDRP